MNSNLYNSYRSGIQLLIFVIAFLNLFFLFNFFLIQILQHDVYNKIIIDEIVEFTKERGLRGKILDKNGTVLADNIKKFEFWVNTNEPFDKDTIVSIFSQTFNKTPNYYSQLLNNNSHHLIIEKDVEGVDCEKILLSINGIKGLYCNTSIKRFYPYDNLASTIIEKTWLFVSTFL